MFDLHEDHLPDPAFPDLLEIHADDVVHRELPPVVPPDAGERSPLIRQMRDLKVVPVRMLVRGWLPAGAVTLFAGRPGAGKGVVLADLIARGSRGHTMPNGDKLVGPFSTLIACTPGEDGPQEWKQRLIAANADQSRVAVVEHVIDECGFEYELLATDMVVLLERAAALGMGCVVIDSLSGIAGGIDTNKIEVRKKLLHPIASAARRLDLVVILVHHVRKSGGDVLSVVSGSQQIVAACRSVLVVVQEQDDDAGTRFLAVGKLNGARASDPVAFTTSGRVILDDYGQRMVDDRGDLVYVPVVAWSERSVTAAEVNAAANNLPGARDEVAGHMRELLADGPVRSTELEEHLAEGGFSRDQVRRTRERIRAAVVKVGNAWWTLPPNVTPADGRKVIEEGGNNA